MISCFSQHVLRRRFSLSRFTALERALVTSEVTLRGTKRTTGFSDRFFFLELTALLGIPPSLTVVDKSECEFDDAAQETKEAKEGSVRNIPCPSLSTGSTPNPITEDGALK